MSEDSKICPCKKIGHDFWPDHTCVAIGNYCTHPTIYTDCDIYKRHVRTTNMIQEMINKKFSQEEVNNEKN